jgi:hypothetical protein
LRIPEGAEPFDSGLLAVDDRFRWTFDVEGTYDYYSKDGLAIGVLGRIVVGKPGGPGEKPPHYGGAEGGAPIYRRAIRVFEMLDSREIVNLKRVAFPLQKFEGKSLESIWNTARVESRTRKSFPLSSTFSPLLIGKSCWGPIPTQLDCLCH